MSDQARVRELLRRTAARKGIRADADVLLNAYRIAYEDSDQSQDRALDWVVCDRVDAIDPRLIAEAMLRECAAWTSLTSSIVPH